MPDVEQDKSGQQNESSGATHGTVLVGFEDQRGLEQVLKEHPVNAQGFSIPIYLLETDEESARKTFEGLGVEAKQEFQSSRVRMFVGRDCCESLIDHLRANINQSLPRSITVRNSKYAELAKRVAGEVDRLVQEQETLTRQRRRRLEELWSRRGLEHWQDRFSQIRNGSPARVMVVTTRYSTYVRHSTQDLVESLNGLGHEAVLLIEPDEHSTITPTMCMEMIESFDPDLIVVANYPRSMHASLFPDGWAHVCWIQDAMPHLFQASPQAPSELDFAVGHLFQDAKAIKGIGSSNCMSFPIPISTDKFHNSAVLSRDDRFVCDIAYVSHQSETAELFHARFVHSIASDKHEAFDRCRRRVEHIINSWSQEIGEQALEETKSLLVSELGDPKNEALKDLLWNQYISPLSERLIRHQTLDWASEISNKHNLRFQIFGHGWDQHPRLSKYASGAIEHGEDLRSCYQQAGIQVHASIHGCGHQRVFECALSGGLPLCRRSWGELYRNNLRKAHEFMTKGVEPDASILGWKWPAYAFRNHPELIAIMDERDRLKSPPLGWDHGCFEQVYAHVRNDDVFNYWEADELPRGTNPIDLLGDPFELTFSTIDEFEERILKAVNDEQWRSNTSNGISQRAQNGVSMDRFALSVLEMVTMKLAESSSSMHEVSA
jgi:hypothetical protein